MTLTDLFTNIANAIRSKDGTTASIVASTFATRILALDIADGNMKTGTVIPTKDTNVTITVTHNLGKIPSVICMVPIDGTKMNGSSYGGFHMLYGGDSSEYNLMFRYYEGVQIGNQEGQIIKNVTATQFDCPVAFATNVFRAGWTYRWFVA